MKKSYMAGLLALCVLSGSLFATSRPSPCEFSFTGEWVFLHPLVGDSFYAMESDISENQNDAVIGKRIQNPLSYHSAFRIAAMYGFEGGCTDIGVSWTSLRGSDTDTFTGLFLPTQMFPGASSGAPQGTISSDLSIDYDRVELLLGYSLFDWQCFSLNLETGLQYASIHEDNLITVPGEEGDNSFTGFADYHKKYWGIGPQFGLDTTYQFSDCFTLTARINAAVLIGESDSDIYAISLDFDPDAPASSKQSCWWVVPSFQSRIGLNYHLTFCWDFMLEAGYEFSTYLDALDQVNYNANTASIAYDNYTTVSFHGPYISATVNF